MTRSRLFRVLTFAAAALCAQSCWAQTPAPPAAAQMSDAPAPAAQTPPAKADAAKPTPSPGPKKAPRLSLDARALSLGGALKAPALWQAYKSRFVSAQGRVVDTANRYISHSEGQGYGMVLAVAANDREAFDRIWGWTRANLMVRDDELLAWRWEPDKRPAVADINNATDGDVLVAWALAEAAEFWGDMSYRTAGRRIAVEFSRKVIVYKSQPEGGILLPAISGFSAEDRSDGPVVNLSYYVFPAFARLKLVAPEVDWSGVTQAGLDILEWTRSSEEALPADWLSLRGKTAKPADGFPAQFAYNAVRVPLYLAWAGIGEREHYAPFMALVKRTRGALAVIDVTNGQEVGKFGDSGIGAIGALTACVFEGSKAPPQFLTPIAVDNYYPATLHLLAVIAMQMRYPSCLR